jgi:LysR family positive regulator for ilvC
MVNRMPRPEHLPLDLLRTFALIAELNGDATTAAERLEISQPSISKRLSALRKVTAGKEHQPWLLLKGKRWLLTAEGERVRGVVVDLVHRYEQMEQFVSGGDKPKSILSIACGQQAASGFVKVAVERLLKECCECRVNLSTVRGKNRIEGVAGGQFDLAVVTESPATIHRIAQRELFVEELFEDRFVLVANPPAKSEWGATWRRLQTERSVSASSLLELPFILPEADAFRRKQFDEWCFRATGKMVDVVLEIGGWQTILAFAESGVGVGLVTRSTANGVCTHTNSKLTIRTLAEKDFSPDPVRLIARKVHGKEEPELTDLGKKLLQMIRKQLVL